MWFLSNTLKENISNLLLQSQFGLVKTVVASASHSSSEKAGIDIDAGILTRLMSEETGVGCRETPRLEGRVCLWGNVVEGGENDTGIVGF